MSYDFTIVIPALNLCGCLELVLRCLDAQMFPKRRFECIVINDGSTDATHHCLESFSPSFELRVISNPTTRGRGAARNMGWREANGEFVLFLDGDMLPCPEWVSSHDAVLASGKYDVAAGARYCLDVDPKQNGLVPYIASLAGSNETLLFRTNAREHFERLRAQAAVGPYKSAAFEKFERELPELLRLYPTSLLSAYSVSGSNLAVRRSLLAELNGFDEFLRRGEDTELGIRLWQIGARFSYVADAAAYHLSASDETGRGLTLSENLCFFYRHPYRLVLLVYIWFVREMATAGTGDDELVTLRGLASGSRSLGTIDIDSELKRLHHPAMPTDCSLSKEELVDYYEDVFGIPESLSSAALEDASVGGLYTKKCGDKHLFDFSLTSNWLRSHSLFHEYLLDTSSYFWAHKGAIVKPRAKPDAITLKCLAQYEISIDPDATQALNVNSILNIPLPVETDAQKNLRFLSCCPQDLLDGANYTQGIIPRYSWSTAQDQIRLSYAFECDVQEIRALGKRDCSESPVCYAEYLRPLLKTRDYGKAKVILRRLHQPGASSYQQAKKIYYWILDNMRNCDSPPGQNNILDSGFGQCRDYSRLFVNLCRLALIPARERCGALFSNSRRSDGQEHIEMKARCYSPFMHTWAECYLSELGWVPVDFCTWVYGTRNLTPLNVQRLALRHEIMDETHLYDEYYFGSLDPFRIHASEDAGNLPIAFEAATGVPPWRLRTCLRHKITCSVSTQDYSGALFCERLSGQT